MRSNKVKTRTRRRPSRRLDATLGPIAIALGDFIIADACMTQVRHFGSGDEAPRELEPLSVEVHCSATQRLIRA